MLNLIWDLDGTLIDSEAEILYHLEYALRDSSMDMSCLIKPIRTGPPLEVMLKESFPAEILTDNKLNEVISFFRKRYDASDFTMTNAFNGIDKIIYDTNNFIHHIVTNKPYYASQAILKKLGWTENISSFKTSSVQNGQRKSKKELFSEIIKESGAKTQSFFGIGDMKTDCIAAKENNITSIGVLWGSGTGEELSGYCDYFFEDSKKLYDYLLGILHEQQ